MGFSLGYYNTINLKAIVAGNLPADRSADNMSGHLQPTGKLTFDDHFHVADTGDALIQRRRAQRIWTGKNALLVSKIRRFGVIAGWLALALIAFVTLSPIQDRPSLFHPQIEHFAAFAVMALAFVLGYPRRTALIVLLVIFSAFTLEAMQFLTPDRHGRLIDAIVKVAGGLAGIGVGRFMLLVLRNQLGRLRSGVEQSAN
ncbi:VanZ family protein [Bradyrhizobium sp. USDA 4503]